MSIALYVFTLVCFLASALAFLSLKGETDKMRRLALAFALATVLTGVVRAGEIPTTGVAAPLPPCTVRATGEIPTTGATAPGTIPTPCASAPQDSSTILTIILTLISIVP